MKNNTNTIDAFKFGFVIYPVSVKKLVSLTITDENQKAEPKKSCDEVIICNKKNIVPFEIIDGLTFGEIKNYGQLIINNHIFFVMYDYIDQIKSINGDSYANIQYAYAINNNEFDDDIEISELIQIILAKEYDKMKNKNKRRAVDFMRKYRVETTASISNCVYYFNSTLSKLAIENHLTKKN